MTEDIIPANIEKLPPIYLIILEFFCPIPKTPMQIKTNKNEVIGDIRSINTLPNFSGFLIKIIKANMDPCKA
jgi:hypothetical protein